MQELITFNMHKSYNFLLIKSFKTKYISQKEALYKFFKENQQYPQEAFKQGEEGEVLIQFTIDEKGKATDPKILRSVSPMLDQEAKRLVLSMPAWKPARQRGLCVESTFILPVYFHIDIWKQYTE